jgi:phosphate/sulfate permease
VYCAVFLFCGSLIFSSSPSTTSILSHISPSECVFVRRRGLQIVFSALFGSAMRANFKWKFIDRKEKKHEKNYKRQKNMEKINTKNR